MYTHYSGARLGLLEQKGGIMYFTIERPQYLFRGMVVLSSVRNGHRTRMLSMKAYKFKEC